MTKARLPLLLGLLLLPGPLLALAPHEVLLLVNRNDLDSKRIAHAYAELRDIPPSNLLELDLPRGRTQLSPEEFTRLVWDPAHTAIRARALQGRIFAWVYSAGFPYRVTTKPQASITGLTIANNQPPPKTLAEAGAWRSPFYAGPDKPGGPVGHSLSAPRFAGIVPTNRPPMAMSLAYLGERGNTADEVLSALRRSAEADYTAPRDAPVLFLTNRNVRSTCRAWQFADTARRINTHTRRQVRISPFPKPVTHNASGILSGTATIDAAAFTLAPGSYAGHLTSFAAAFDRQAQTKCSDWIRAGAAGTSGTVVEPRAIWTKFPHARIFEHQGNGLTLIESLHLATRCPIQTYFLGDPLSRPFMKPVGLRPVIDVTDDLIHIQPGPLVKGAGWFVFADGRLITRKMTIPRVSIPLHYLSTGWHDLLIFAFLDEKVRHYESRTFPVRIPGPRQVTLAQTGPSSFLLQATQAPDLLLLRHGHRILGRGERITINPLKTGTGPFPLFAEAIYDGNIGVRSNPIRWQLR